MENNLNELLKGYGFSQDEINGARKLLDILLAAKEGGELEQSTVEKIPEDVTEVAKSCNLTVQEQTALTTTKTVEEEKKDQVQKQEKLLNAFGEWAATSISLNTIKITKFFKKQAMINDSKKEINEEYIGAKSDIDEEYDEQLQELLLERDTLITEEKSMLASKSVSVSNKKIFKCSPEYKEYLNNKKTIQEQIKVLVNKGENKEEIISKTEELFKLIEADPISKYDTEIKEIDEKISQIREEMSECEKRLANLDKSKNNEINELESEKEQKMMALPKQNIFQKLVGTVVNVGKKAFKAAKEFIARLKEEDVDDNYFPVKSEVRDMDPFFAAEQEEVERYVDENFIVEGDDKVLDKKTNKPVSIETFEEKKRKAIEKFNAKTMAIKEQIEKEKAEGISIEKTEKTPDTVQEKPGFSLE